MMHCFFATFQVLGSMNSTDTGSLSCNVFGKQTIRHENETIEYPCIGSSEHEIKTNGKVEEIPFGHRLEDKLVILFKPRKKPLKMFREVWNFLMMPGVTYVIFYENFFKFELGGGRLEVVERVANGSGQVLSKRVITNPEFEDEGILYWGEANAAMQVPRWIRIAVST